MFSRKLKQNVWKRGSKDRQKWKRKKQKMSGIIYASALNETDAEEAVETPEYYSKKAFMHTDDFL